MTDAAPAEAPPTTFEHLIGTQTCRIHALRLELTALGNGGTPPPLSYEQVIGSQTCELYELERQVANARAAAAESAPPSANGNGTHPPNRAARRAKPKSPSKTGA